MKKFITIISVMAAFAAAFTSCVEEEIVGTADGEGLYLNKVELTLIKGNSEALVATVTPKDAATLVWSSAADSVATVDAEGLVHAVGAGETVITAAAAGRTVECVVSVKSPVTVLTLDQTEVFIYKGEEAEVNATVGPEDINVPFNYTWISSDESIFTVTADAENPSKAVIYGRMGGFATLYVQAGDVTTSIPVTIDVDLAGLTITGAPTGKIYKGDSFQLGVDKDPLDAIDVLSPVWSSSDETVMTVDQNGLVHAVGAGTASIIVESNGFSASVELTIKVMTTVTFLPTSANYSTGDLTFAAANGGGSNPSFYSSYFRLRNNNTLTFSVPEGLLIAEIKFTPYSSSYSLPANVDTGSYDASSYTWTGESQEVTFTVTTSSTYMRGITVTYKD